MTRVLLTTPLLFFCISQWMYHTKDKKLRWLIHRLHRSSRCAIRYVLCSGSLSLSHTHSHTHTKKKKKKGLKYTTGRNRTFTTTTTSHFMSSVMHSLFCTKHSVCQSGRYYKMRAATWALLLTQIDTSETSAVEETFTLTETQRKLVKQKESPFVCIMANQTIQKSFSLKTYEL